MTPKPSEPLDELFKKYSCWQYHEGFKEAILAHFISKQTVAEALDSSYEYGITDIELAEHQGVELDLISRAGLKSKLLNERGGNET